MSTLLKINKTVNSEAEHAIKMTGVDPYGTDGTLPINIWTNGDIITNVSPIFEE